jgi:membrane-associated phospholipid phosphatase
MKRQGRGRALVGALLLGAGLLWGALAEAGAEALLPEALDARLARAADASVLSLRAGVVEAVAERPDLAAAILARASALAPQDSAALRQIVRSAYPGLALAPAPVQIAQAIPVPSTPVAPASGAAPSAAPLENGDYWWGYIRNPIRIVAAPYYWSGQQWLRNALVLGAVGAVVAFDDSIQDFTQDNRSDGIDKLADLGAPFGEGSVSLGLIGGGFAAGLVSGDAKLQETALLGFQGFVLTSALTLGLKLATHRARPRSGADFKSFDGPGTERDNRSFPSGHAARAFTLATVLASQYDEDPYVAPVAYGLATLTALSRINDDEHWVSDVAFGAALGYGIGKLVALTSPFDSASNVALRPGTRRGDPGLTVVFSF